MECSIAVTCLILTAVSVVARCVFKNPGLVNSVRKNASKSMISSFSKHILRVGN